MTNADNDTVKLLEEAVNTAISGATSSTRSSERLAELLGATAAIGSAASGNSATASTLAWVNPVLGALWSLFSGSESSSSVTLEKATLPDAVSYQLGVGGATGTIVSVNRDEQGQARATSSSGTSASVVVNIQALDTQSFLDRTPEIAQAVKRALLESDGLGTVIGEL